MFRSSAHSPRARSYRPGLEALETRNLLSVCTVDRLTDNNPAGGGEGADMAGDLRWCVMESLIRADIIDFSVTGTINLQGALPNLARSVSIEGPGADQLTVRRETGGNYRIFTVSQSTTVRIAGLTIANGFLSFDLGGGLRNEGTLTVANCAITGNTAQAGGGVYNSFSGILTISNSTIAGNTAESGGGVYSSSSGTTTISNSTISGNTAVGGGASGGGVSNSNGMLTITNGTITGNVASGSVLAQGGGIQSSAGTLTVVSCTISSNTADSPSDAQGGGIDARVGGANLRNTVVAGNMARGAPDFNGRLATSDHNLFGNTDGGFGFDDTDLLNVDPLLGPLQDSGGPTRTMALMPGSPALNAGDPAQLGSADQRGVVRSGGVNIGAYQASASAFVLTAPDMVAAGVPFDVDVTAVDTFGQVAVGYVGTVTFTTTDPDSGVVLPADRSFTLDDGGTYTFTDTGRGETTLVTPGEQTLTVRDDADDAITGSATITVGSSSPREGRHLAGDVLLAAITVPSPTVRLAQQAASADGFFALLRREDLVSLSFPLHDHRTETGTLDWLREQDLL